MTSVNIPSSISSLGIGVFVGCSGLTSITVDSGNPNYDSRGNCNAIIKTESNMLKSGCQNTIIPNSITAIDRYAFAHLETLTSVTLPNSVTSIGEGAFEDCIGLATVTIPNSVTSISNYAFRDCIGLTDVYSYITDPSSVIFGSSVFKVWVSNVDDDYSTRTLHVPHGTAEAYLIDKHWYPYFGQIMEDIIKGDVNCDHEVNIADVNAVVNIILGGDGTHTAPDVNRDGEVNIADINTVIEIILSK